MTTTRLALLALVLFCGSLAAQDETPWMGVRLQVIEKSERDALKIESGLRITLVEKGSPAEQAGLEKNDIILSAGEKTVNSIEDMANILSKLRPGDTLGLGVRHADGKVEPFMVKLGRKGQSSDEFKDDVRARELRDALLVNPYDTERMADALRFALEMSPDEQADRMKRMREVVREHNIYRWAGELIEELTRVRLASESAPVRAL